MQKLAILLRVAFGSAFDADAIYYEGIQNIAPEDIAYAQQFERTIKLLAIAKRRGERSRPAYTRL